jgi:hypothetical protein
LTHPPPPPRRAAALEAERFLEANGHAEEEGAAAKSPAKQPVAEPAAKKPALVAA